MRLCGLVNTTPVQHNIHHTVTIIVIIDVSPNSFSAPDMRFSRVQCNTFLRDTASGCVYRMCYNNNSITRELVIILLLYAFNCI